MPLLERVKFCAIFSSNLDEFFMVRVAGLHDQIDAGIETPLQDGRTPNETIDVIRRLVREHTARQARCLDHDLRPALAEHGIRIVGSREVGRRARQLDERFRSQIFPVLTPLAVGLGRPFPYISNLSLSLGVVVRDPVGGLEAFARVKVPKEMLPRFVPVGDGRTFVPLEDLIAEQPRRAVPRHGDRRPRGLPRHPRRRLHGLRRGRRPRARRRGRAAPPPLRRGRARRGRRRR